jgi:hypothetical protein
MHPYNPASASRGIIPTVPRPDERARKIIKPFVEEMVGKDQVTAGISMFYFEEEL